MNFGIIIPSRPLENFKKQMIFKPLVILINVVKSHQMEFGDG